MLVPDISKLTTEILLFQSKILKIRFENIVFPAENDRKITTK